MFSIPLLSELRLLRVPLALLLAVGAVPAGSAYAQQIDPPRTYTLATTVGGVFTVTPLVPVLARNSQSGNLCSPGACYTGSVTARGNSGWQLQVKLVPTPLEFTVAFVRTTVPASVQAVNSGTQTWLNSTTWLTVASSTSSSAGADIGVMFNARRGTAASGVLPTGAQLTQAVMYRVVSFP